MSSIPYSGSLGVTSTVIAFLLVHLNEQAIFTLDEIPCFTVTSKIKIEQCGDCKMANKSALKKLEPACCVFDKTGKYPQIRNGICLARPQKAVKHA